MILNTFNYLKKDQLFNYKMSENKHDYYFNDSCERLNDSIYKTTAGGKKYIIKDLDLEDESIFYSAVREISVLMILDHPNIIKITDYYIYNNILYIVQPYIENTLYSLIKKHRKAKTNFTKEQIHKILSGSFDALYYLHQNNITHRDLKPENILVTDDFTPIIIDFGQAKKLTFKNSTHISTCYYRSPEVLGFYEKQFTKNYGKKIDTWGMGLIAFEMITIEQLAKLPEDYEESESETESEESTTKEEELYKDGDDNDNSSIFGTDSEYESESDSEIDSEEHAEDNIFIIHDLFRKLGVPSKHVLDNYNLRKYIPEGEELPNNPLDYLKKRVANDKELHFLLNTMAYDPDKRYSIKQCIQSSYINNPLPANKIIEKRGLIQLNNANLNMGYFQKQFQIIMKEMKIQGIKDDSLFKAKRLALYFIGVYKKKIPKDWVIRLIGVCIYICDNLVSSGNHDVQFYTDILECSENKFFVILREVMMKSIKDLFII